MIAENTGNLLSADLNPQKLSFGDRVFSISNPGQPYYVAGFGNGQFCGGIYITTIKIRKGGKFVINRIKHSDRVVPSWLYESQRQAFLALLDSECKLALAEIDSLAATTRHRFARLKEHIQTMEF